MVMRFWGYSADMQMVELGWRNAWCGYANRFANALPIEVIEEALLLCDRAGLGGGFWLVREPADDAVG